MKELQSVSWQGVLDEAQNIKNQKTVSAAVAILISVALKNAGREQASRTVVNFRFSQSRVFRIAPVFQRRFAMPIEKWGCGFVANTAIARSAFILRRIKTDREIIQDLPEKQEMTVFCGLGLNSTNVVVESLAAIESAQGLQRRG